MGRPPAGPADRDEQAPPAATECHNPTQAGSQKDDDRRDPPFHGPSTSALSEFEKVAENRYTAASRLAMYVPVTQGTRLPDDDCTGAEYQRDVSPMSLGLSHYWLTRT